MKQKLTIIKVMYIANQPLNSKFLQKKYKNWGMIYIIQFIIYAILKIWYKA